ncbi:MAG: TonB-dependent receptor [Gammaproteobacteria bacterium]|nr:TonB-dependent receptor [Gammaproteobacteria bacterium]
MRIYSLRSLTLLFGVCGFFTTSLSVQAQIEEVVVTAQKRAESLQEVPIAISAFSGESLNKFGVNSAEEIMALIPNAGIIAQGGSKYNFFLRGVGTNDFHLNVVGAVGVYLDDVALNSPFQLAFSTFDTERVEVLKGPQNTLFGRNTTGGAVNYVSRKPVIDDGMNGYIKAGYGSFDQIDVEGAFGMALGDTAAMRVSLVSNKRDGVFDNLTTGEDVGETDKQAGRFQLLWEPNEDWSFLANVHGGVNRGDPYPFKMVGKQDPANPLVPCAVPLDQLQPQNNPNCVDSTGFNFQANDWEDVYGGTRHRENADMWGTGLKAVWNVGSLTVTSISAYDSVEVLYLEDSDGGPNVAFQFMQEGEYDQWAQEVRVQSADDQSWRWIAGFYYFFEEGRFSSAVRRTPAPPAPSAANFFKIVPNTIVDQDNEVFSGYFQIEHDLQDNLTATVGLRHTKETKQGYNNPSVRCTGQLPGPPASPPFCPNVGDNAHIGFNAVDLPGVAFPPVEVLDGNFSEWGSRFALDWQATEDMLVYASISRGFKGGGFSLAALQALTGNAAQGVEPEVLWAYELGIKSNWMDNSLQLNGAVFYYNWENMQTFQPLFNPVSGFAVPQLLNVPEASMLGAEFDIQWIPAEGWLLTAGLGLLDGEIDDPGLIVGVAKGNSLPNTPDVSFTGAVRKEFQLANGTAAIQTDWRYQDFVTFSVGNERVLSQSGYWLLNARGSYAFGSSEEYEVSVWGKNLTGEEFCNSKTDLAGLTEAIICVPGLSEPTFGVTASYNFN